MSNPNFGVMGPFDPSTENWISYEERFRLYLTANEVASDERKQAIFLTTCGTSTYNLLRSLAAPKKPPELTFAELVKLAAGHYHPKPSLAVQRFKFFSRSRHAGESVAAFVAELKRLSEHCAFGDALQDMLRDRLVCGIHDQRTQRRLLAETDLTLQKAFDVAQAIESADSQVKELQQPGRAEVHAVKPPHRPFRTTARAETTRRSSPTHRSSTSSSAHHDDSSRTPFRTAQHPSAQQPRTPCPRCARMHWASQCPFRQAVCHHCGKRGHIQSSCRVRSTTVRHRQHDSQLHSQQQSSKVQYRHANTNSDQVYQCTGSSTPPIRVELTVNGAALTMEVDTGASVSLISDQTYRTTWTAAKRPPLQPSDTRLYTYSGELIEVLGTISVTVCYKQQTKQLSLLVVPTEGPALFGRDWLQAIVLEWKQLNRVHNIRSRALQDILNQYPELFKDGMGTLQGTTVKIHIQQDARPRFFRARPVPYALKDKVTAELERLRKADVIEPVQYSDWAAPIVPVLKNDGSIRICGDFKQTINTAAIPDKYPLPRVDDLLATLAGGETFTKLDLAHAYQQLVLDEESSKLATVNTHQGLYRYKRLPFGISAAPAIFQRTMESLLQGIPKVCVYIDDVLVTGHTEEEHMTNLAEVLRRMASAGMRLKRDKCFFMMSQVHYLGHTVSAKGIQPTQDKVRAVKDAPAPTNLHQLKSFIGLINFYAKFLPNLSTVLAPLYVLLQKNRPWTWGPSQQRAFQQAKERLLASSLLVHFSPTQPVLLAADASPYGLGAVLSHTMADGSERPIAYASRSLTPTERRYSQLDKEALAIIFAVSKFRQYLLGHHFTIVSDHKPLSYLLSPDKPVPPMASARLQRWALLLSAYHYDIRYRPGKSHANADTFSRLPLSTTPTSTAEPGETVLLFECLSVAPLTVTDIRRGTDRDPLLSRIRTYTLQGWPSSLTEGELQPYWRRRDEISVSDHILLWGSRVIVPPKARERVLEVLHSTHPGVSRMKSLARSYIWWPSMDSDIEQRVRNCQSCQQHLNAPAKAPLHPWEWPERAWSRVHVDYAGPLNGLMFLIVIDAYSKWMEVVPVKNATSQVTIDKLRSIFVTHGLPEMLVSDNGTAFTSAEFKEFTSRNAIRHVFVSPYHPSSNGLAERAVQSFKSAWRKSSEGSTETRIAKFLFHQRLTPHTSTGNSPAELLMGRRPRSLLDVVRPDLSKTVRQHQESQKRQHDRHAKTRQFGMGDTVFIRNFSQQYPHPTWLSGEIVSVCGPVSYTVRLSDHRTVRRHVDHIRRRPPTQPSDRPSTPPSDSTPQPTDPNSAEFDSCADVYDDLGVTLAPVQVPTPAPQLRRSSRLKRPPDRYQA